MWSAMNQCNYRKTEQHGYDVLPLLDSPFTLFPMRATGISGHELNESRKTCLEHAARETSKSERKSLFVALRADEYFKGPLEPYRERALAVTKAMNDLARKDGFDIKSIGYIPNATKDMKSWPNLLMFVYQTNSDGINMYMIPSLGVEDENPLVPSTKIRENGLIVTGKPENVEKWRDLGFSVKLL